MICSIDQYKLRMDIFPYSRNIVIDAKTRRKACKVCSAKVRSIAHGIASKKLFTNLYQLALFNMPYTITESTNFMANPTLMADYLKEVFGFSLRPKQLKAIRTLAVD